MEDLPLLEEPDQSLLMEEQAYRLQTRETILIHKADTIEDQERL